MTRRRRQPPREARIRLGPDREHVRLRLTHAKPLVHERRKKTNATTSDWSHRVVAFLEDQCVVCLGTVVCVRKDITETGWRIRCEIQ